MGAWGYGILQNDPAQDSLCEVARRIEIDIEELSHIGSEEGAAKIGAATGLLLQFSPYSFNTENAFYQILIQKLAANLEYFSQLPGNSAAVLNAIIDGQGTQLAARDGEVDPAVDKALHGDDNKGFLMEKMFSVCEHDLFRHPAAVAYVQGIFDQLVVDADEGFAEEDIVSDLSREAEFMGMFGLLLILPQGSVNPDKFKQWRNQFHKVWENFELDDDESEKLFAEKYNSNLELAFECGIKKFSTSQ